MGYWLPVVVLFFLFTTDLQVYFGQQAYDVRLECEAEAARMLQWHREHNRTPGLMFYETVCAEVNLGKGINYGGPRPDLTDSRS